MDKTIKLSGIAGTGFYVPDKILTNADIEKILDTTDEWIVSRTGIRERRIASDSQVTSDLGAQAGILALKNAGISPGEVGLIITCSLSPDTVFPSTASSIQVKIGAKNAACFDLEAACSGFNYGLFVADSFVKSGFCETVLLVGAELFSRILDWKDRNTAVLFGDGAGAVVLRSTGSTDRGILAHYIGADGNGADLLHMPGGGSRNPATIETVNNRMHYLKMNGKEIYKFATKMMVEALYRVLDKAGLESKDINLLIPHQANIRILKYVAEKLEIPEEKVFINVHKYGNTSAASIPIAMHEALTEGRIKSGDIVATVSFGAGLTWGASVIRW